MPPSDERNVMVVNFQIDRVNPPVAFYTVRDDPSGFKEGVDVFAQSGEHPDLAMMRLGLVTMQTPFGQCTHRGFLRKDIRPATPDEVRAALNRNHKEGPGFVPETQPYMNRFWYWVIKQRWKLITRRQREAVLKSLPST
ncbi:MAG TPA: hypothetical protein VFZ58_03455 [Candidatus Saccharimonadales bacterium]